MKTVALLLALAGFASAETLTDATYEKTRDEILPTKDELAWQALGWRTSLWAGVVDAQKAEKPVLLYVMNGHPLGCT